MLGKNNKLGMNLLRAASAGVALMALSAAPALAVPIWGTSGLGELTGSRDSTATGGVTGTKAWANGGFNIAWDIQFDDNTDQWTYQYHLTTSAKDISHWLLEVTEDSDSVLVAPGSSAAVSPTTYSPSDPGKSNPLLPNSLFGVKFDYGDTDEVYTLVTDRAPVYGVFYAKDGKDGGKDVVAWSNALASSDYKTSESLTLTDFIVRPNGKHTPPGGGNPGGDPDGDPDPDPQGSPVPEPMTAGLTAMSGLGLALRFWRRRR